MSSGVDGGAAGAQTDDSSSTAAPASTEITADGPAPDMVPKTAYNKTAEEEGVQDHPKGCGCVAAGVEGGSLAGTAGVLLGAAVVLARRRRRATPEA